MKLPFLRRFSLHARSMFRVAYLFAVIVTPAAGQSQQATRLPARELLGGVAVSALVQWYAPDGDLGAYWKDAPVVGLRARKPMDRHFGLVMQGAVSYLRPAESPRRDRIPDLGLMTLHVGLRGQESLLGPIEGIVEVGLETQTFWYMGEKAIGNIYARIESEIGVGFLVGLEVRLPSLPALEIIAGRHVVFTGPEYVGITSVGISAQLFDL